MSLLGKIGGGGPARSLPFAVTVVTVLAGLVAVAVAWAAQPYAVGWATRALADRATEQVESRVLAGLSAADLEAPPSPDRLRALASRLDPLLARLREDGSAGIAQVNLYARDGTILYSGQPDRVGRKVPPARVPRLAGALAGSVNARLLALSSADNADLLDRFPEALAVYAPLARDGRTVGAVEAYADPTLVRAARLGVWAAVVGVVTLGLLLYVRARQAEQQDRLERLTREAFFDPLTGLANRALFRFRLQQAFHRSARRGEAMAVMFLDLDRFKQVNDTLGHAAGDELLVAVSRRLLAAVRPEDTVARLGGDEFTVLLESVPGLAEAEAVAGRILTALRAPHALAGQARVVKTSIGIALRSPAHQKPEDVLKDADAALYRAKADGKDRFAVSGLPNDAPLRRAS